MLKNKKYHIFFSVWLIGLMTLVALMIIVGGLTRLTESGLSITKWELLSGILPPFSVPEWENYFEQYATAGNSILRPIHYPPITIEPNNAVRAAAHGDINLITLLMGAHGRGLQVKNHIDEWVDAIANEDELMINVGDMLSRLTNNQLKSTIHQVINPPKELWGTSRYSIPFFMHPVSSMPLNCLENCISKEHPKGFEDITAGAYLNERLIELGLKK